MAEIIKENNQIKTQVFVKKSIGPLKYLFAIRKMQLMVSCTEPRKFPQIPNQRQLELKQSFRNILEAYFMKQLNPSFNDQLNSKILILFRYGVT